MPRGGGLRLLAWKKKKKKRKSRRYNVTKGLQMIEGADFCVYICHSEKPTKCESVWGVFNSWTQSVDIFYGDFRNCVKNEIFFLFSSFIIESRKCFLKDIIEEKSCTIGSWCHFFLFLI